MDAEDSTLSRYIIASDAIPDWLLQVLEGRPLRDAFTDEQIPPDHRTFEQVRHTVLRRGRDENGAPFGPYEEVGEFWTIERKPVA